MVALPALHVGSPSQAGPLTLFPIWTDAPLDTPPFQTTLPRNGSINELPDGPSVGELTVTNPGAEPVLLLEGALIDGGWQHRVLTHSILIGAHTDTNVEVRCIEKDRWNGEHAQRLGGRHAPLAVRGALRGLRTGTARLQPEHQRSADQGDVWQRVAHYENSHGRSHTSSLVEVQGGLDHRIGEITRAARPLPAQRGVLVGVAGHPALLEIFDHPQTLAEQWDMILASVAVDALLTPAAVTPGHRARAFVSRAQATILGEAGPAGAATAVVGSDPDLISVRAITTAGRIIHAAVINSRHRLVLAA